MQYSNKKIDIQKFINDSKNKSNSEIKDILKKVLILKVIKVNFLKIFIYLRVSEI